MEGSNRSIVPSNLFDSTFTSALPDRDGAILTPNMPTEPSIMLKTPTHGAFSSQSNLDLSSFSVANRSLLGSLSNISPLNKSGQSSSYIAPTSNYLSGSNDDSRGSDEDINSTLGLAGLGGLNTKISAAHDLQFTESDLKELGINPSFDSPNLSGNIPSTTSFFDNIALTRNTSTNSSLRTWHDNFSLDFVGKMWNPTLMYSDINHAGSANDMLPQQAPSNVAEASDLNIHSPSAVNVMEDPSPIDDVLGPQVSVSWPMATVKKLLTAVEKYGADWQKICVEEWCLKHGLSEKDLSQKFEEIKQNPESINWRILGLRAESFFMNLTKVPKSRKRPREVKLWTNEELDALRNGVERFGVGAWMQIKRRVPLLRHRTTVSLKDKWRNEEKKKQNKNKRMKPEDRIDPIPSIEDFFNPPC